LLDESAAVLNGHPDAGQLLQWRTEATRLLTKSKSRPHSTNLTTAERRVLRLLDSDLTLREIGRELDLSLNTVRTHTHSIYRKLGVSSRAEAVQTSRANRASRSTSSRSTPVPVARISVKHRPAYNAADLTSADGPVSSA
jgi:LuxR family maltose regulon positive regulatory protein